MPGNGGNNIRLDVDYGTTDPTRLFNLTVTQVQPQGAKSHVVSTETFRNLGMDSTRPNFAPNAVNNGSQLAALALLSSAGRPAQSGTASAGFAAIASPWVKSTVYNVGDMVIDGNGNLQQVAKSINTKKSGAAAPAAWATNVGDLTVDADVTWQLLPTGRSFLPQWSQNTIYKINDAIVDSNGNMQVVTAAGTSAATTPVWSKTIGANSPADNTVTWKLEKLPALSLLFDGTLQALLNTVAFSNTIDLDNGNAAVAAVAGIARGSVAKPHPQR